MTLTRPRQVGRSLVKRYVIKIQIDFKIMRLRRIIFAEVGKLFSALGVLRLIA